MMMALDLFVFSLSTVAYQDLQHKLAWRHPSSKRVGARPSRQFTGPDDETITLTGTLYPEYTGGTLSLDVLRTMADTGQSFILIEGTGTVYGWFVIEGLDVKRTYFFRDGAARKIEFTLALARADDFQTNVTGVLATQLGVI